MTSPVFIDSNVPMYIVGADHPNKLRAVKAIETLVKDDIRLVTNAEVFQEISHRYSHLRCLEMIEPAFSFLLSLVDEVMPVTIADVMLAKALILSSKHPLSSRDAIHIASMKRADVDVVFSFDQDFDAFDGLRRIAG